MKHYFVELSLIAASWAVAALHIGAYILAPVSSIQPSNTPFLAWLLYLCVVTGAVLLMARSKPRPFPEELTRFLSTAGPLLPALAVVALLGLGAHVYAKIAAVKPYEGYCLGELREAFVSGDRAARSMMVRLLSVGGHLLSAIAYAGAVITTYLLIVRTPKSKKLWAYLGLFIAVILVYALAIVSRTVALTLFAVVLFTSLIAAAHAPVSLGRALSRACAPTALMLLVGAAFTFGVSWSQMFCAVALAPNERAGFSARYFEGYADELPVRSRLTSAVAEPGNFADNANINAALAPARQWMQIECPICGLSALYLSHGLFNFEAITHTERRGERVLLAFATSWIQRIKLWSPEGEAAPRVHGRGGMGLVGAAYHDFGWRGVLLLALAMAVGIVLVGELLRANSGWGAAGLIGYLALGITILFEFMFVAPATVAFPFVIFSCTVVFIALVIARARAVRLAH